jgi:hypothetical protein
MRFVVISLTVWMLLAGCASSASDGWTKAGASEQQVGRDTADCLAGAQVIVGGPQGPRTTIQQDRYRRCMVERGYAETPRK